MQDVGISEPRPVEDAEYGADNTKRLRADERPRNFLRRKIADGVQVFDDLRSFLFERPAADHTLTQTVVKPPSKFRNRLVSAFSWPPPAEGDQTHAGTGKGCGGRPNDQPPKHPTGSLPCGRGNNDVVGWNERVH